MKEQRARRDLIMETSQGVPGGGMESGEGADDQNTQ